MRLLQTIFLATTIISCSNAQTGTEVYLFDLTFNDGSYSLSNPVDISNNPGYDNQPSFSLDGSTLYFTSNRNGETDLVAYNINSAQKTWLTSTENRSEYSPTITPDGKHISFITLSSDGIQEFRKLNLETGEEELIEDDPIIGYFVWIDEVSYLSFVLANEDQPSTLQIHSIETGEKTILGENPGRSFQHIPGAKAVSYIQTKNNETGIYAYFYESDSSEIISPTLEFSQDMAWLPSGEMIMGKGSELFINKGNEWNLLTDLEQYSFSGITRIAVNAGGTKIAIVVEE